MEGGVLPEERVEREPRRARVARRVTALMRHEARRFLLPIAVLSLVGHVGMAAAPTLAHDQPLVLMALNPRLAFLTVAANKVALVPFLIVGMIRLCVADPFHFALGRKHGTAALNRVPGRLGRAVHKLTTMGGRGVPVLVFLRPNGTNLAIAGASPTNRLHVAIADVVGTALYLILVHTAGTAVF